MDLITPVILSGGGGTRLWPLSTPQRPKQFLPLTDERTMFQLTVQRTADRDRFTAPIIVANASHASLIDAQLAEMGVEDALVMLEPCPRNTAPAIAIAALAAPEPESLLLVMPSDHVIADLDAFGRAISMAAKLAGEGWLVTFGIDPTGPETGYGYIAAAEPLAAGGHAVSRFIEKPDRAIAQAMLDAGHHYWNGGIFLFRASAFLDALGGHAPAMLEAANMAMSGANRIGQHIHPEATAFAASPSDSIDYAVMEKAEKVATVPVAMGWSDVGSWDALHEIGRPDEAGNVVRGEFRHIGASENLICSDRVRVSAIGVEGLIIVASGDDILIVPRGQSQNVKLLA